MLMPGRSGLVSVLLASTSGVLLLFFLAPSPRSRFFLPWRNEDFIRFTDDIDFYTYHHPNWSLALFSVVYIYLQSFCVPGSFLMNLLAGALYGPLYGTLLTVWLMVIGSSCCFMLSAKFGREIILSCLSEQLEEFRNKMQRSRRRTVLVLLSARIFPFTPHWLFNICSPFAGISLWMHTATVTFGLFPYNVLCVRGGSDIYRKRTWESVMNPATLSNLLIIALLLLIAGCFERRQKQEAASCHDDRLPHHTNHGKPN